MTVYVGPTNWWWKDSPDASINCKVKGTLNELGLGAALPDGSTIMCASNGVAILVAPFCTQACESWAGGQYNTTDVPGTEMCCVCEWSGLETALTNAGFTPSEWFVPSLSQLQLGHQCRNNWDSTAFCYMAGQYWSSTEINAACAYSVTFAFGGLPCNKSKAGKCYVRAFRCVTY